MFRLHEALPQDLVLCVGIGGCTVQVGAAGSKHFMLLLPLFLVPMSCMLCSQERWLQLHCWCP